MLAGEWSERQIVLFSKFSNPRTDSGHWRVRKGPGDSIVDSAAGHYPRCRHPSSRCQPAKDLACRTAHPHPTSSSINTLSLLHRNGTRISQYFRSIIFRAPGHPSLGSIRALAENSCPVTLPRMVEGAIRTWGLFRIRFTFPDFGFVKTYNLPSCSANHTGVLTGIPFLRNVVSEMYF